MNKNINIALVGLGQVGIFLYNELNSKKKEIEIKTGKRINIVAISAKNKNKKRRFNIDKKIFYSNPLKIFKEKKIDILGFSMGGIIGRHWLQKFDGYKRTRRLISIGSPHKGTLMAQLIPKYPFRGISEMKINSKFLRELANNDFLLDDIECINFFTYWDMMVFPSWWTNLNFGKKISVKVYKHRNLVRNKSVVDKIIDEIIK